MVGTGPEPGVPAILVTDGQAPDHDAPTVIYRPPSLVVGLGASRGVPAEEVDALIDQALATVALSPRSVRAAATADLKADEEGLLAAVRERGWPLVTFPAASLATVAVPHPSETVRAAVGTPSVAEAAALLAASHLNPTNNANPTNTLSLQPTNNTNLTNNSSPISPGSLIVPKRTSAHATVAIARTQPRGRLAIVGIGPGARDLLTPRAVAELRRATIVVGLDQYLRQVEDLLRPGTTIRASGLGQEQERAEAAVADAAAGHAVALIGSGDAGVYAMGSPALESAGQARHRRHRCPRGDGRPGRGRRAGGAAWPRPHHDLPV